MFFCFSFACKYVCFSCGWVVGASNTISWLAMLLSVQLAREMVLPHLH